MRPVDLRNDSFKLQSSGVLKASVPQLYGEKWEEVDRISLTHLLLQPPPHHETGCA